MAFVFFSHAIVIDSVPSDDPNVPFSWSTGSDTAFDDNPAINTGADDMLDIGERYGSVNARYSGHTIEVDGETFAVFSTDTASYIPYNPADGVDLTPLANGGVTTGYMADNAIVFNCFATGTTILTPDGERAIETLQPGDRVMTHDGRSTPVIWVARQTVVNPRFVELGRRPVRIDAGALGPDLPNRPLTVTGDHALLFGDMLVNAGALAEDGTPVRFLPLEDMPTKFVWWHVELENHEVVLANGGVPAESFIDYVGRSGFDNYDEYLALAGADRLIPEMPFVRLSARRLLPANGLRGLPAIARRPLIAAPRKTAA